MKKARTVLIIGLAAILGGVTLAWLSSPASLTLDRDNEDYVTATIESRLFGLFLNGTGRIERIRSVSLVPSPDPDTRTRTPDRLIFETRTGSVDFGRNQQRFAVDHAEIAGFLAASGPATLTISSIARGAEQRRFVIAQVVAILLMLGGVGLEAMAISAVRPR